MPFATGSQEPSSSEIHLGLSLNWKPSADRHAGEEGREAQTYLDIQQVFAKPTGNTIFQGLSEITDKFESEISMQTLLNFEKGQVQTGSSWTPDPDKRVPPVGLENI